MVVSHWLQRLFPRAQFSKTTLRQRSSRRLEHGIAYQSGIARLSEELEDRTLLAAVYVNKAFVGTVFGADPDGAGPATSFGTDSFATIQNGINGASNGDTLFVANGAYSENLVLNKALTITGNTANPALVTVTATTGNGLTVNPGATAATVRGLKINAVAGSGVIVNSTTGTNVAITLEDIVVTNAGSNGIFVNANNAGSIANVTVRRANFNDAGANAIRIAALNASTVNFTANVVSGARAGQDGINLVSNNSTANVNITNAGDFSFADGDGVDVLVTGGAHPKFKFNLSGTPSAKANFSGAGEDGLSVVFDKYRGFNSAVTSFAITDVNFNNATNNGFTLSSIGTTTPGMESTFNGTVLRSSFNNAGNHGVEVTLAGNTPKSALELRETTSTNAAVDGIHIDASLSSFLDIDIIDGDQTGAGNQAVSITQDGGSTVDLLNNNDRGFEFVGDNGTTLIARISGSLLSTQASPALNGIKGTLTNGATMNLIVENSTIGFTTRNGMDVTASGGSTFNATFINTPIFNSGRHGVSLVFDNSVASIVFTQGSTITSSTASNMQILASNGSTVDMDFDATSSNMSGAGVDGIFASAVGAGTIVTVDYAGLANLNNSGRDGLSLNSQNGGRVNVNALSGLSINDAGDNAISVFGGGANSTIVADNVTMDRAGGRAMQTIVAGNARVINLLTNVHSISGAGQDALFFNATSSFLAIELSGTALDPLDIAGSGGDGVSGYIGGGATMVLRLSDFNVINSQQSGIELDIAGGKLLTSQLNRGTVASNGQNIAGTFSSGIALNATNGGSVGVRSNGQIGLAMADLLIENNNALPTFQDNGLRITADGNSYVKARVLTSEIRRNASDGVYVKVNADQSMMDQSLVDLTIGMTDIRQNVADGVNLNAAFGNSSVGNVNSGIIFNFNQGSIEFNQGDGIEANAIGDPAKPAANTTIVLNLNNAIVENNDMMATNLNAVDGGIIIQGVTGGVFGDPLFLCADGADSAVQLSLNNVLLTPQAAPGGPAITVLAINGGSVVADFKNMTAAGGTAITGHEGQAFVFLVETGGTLIANFDNVEMTGNLTNVGFAGDAKTGLPVIAAVQGEIRDSGSTATVNFKNTTISNHRLKAVDINVLDGGVLNSTITTLTLLNNNTAVGQGTFDISVDQAGSEAHLDINGLSANGSTGRGIDLRATSDALLDITRFTNVSATGAFNDGLNIQVSGDSQLNPLVISGGAFGGSLDGDGINIDINANLIGTSITLLNTTANNARRNGIDINSTLGGGNVVVNIENVQAMNALGGRGLDLSVGNVGAAGGVDINFTGVNNFNGAAVTGIDARVTGAVSGPVSVDFTGTTSANNAASTGVNLFFQGSMTATTSLDGVSANNAGTRGLNLRTQGSAVALTDLNISNSNFNLAGDNAISVLLDAQPIPTNIDLTSVQANMAGGRGVDINLTNVRNGNTTIDLNNVSADQAAGGTGLAISTVGLLATDTVAVNVGMSSFDMAGGDGINMRFNGAAGSAATVNLTGTGATDAAGSGLVINTTGPTALTSASVTGLGSDFSRATGGDGVTIDVDNQSTPTSITLTNVLANTASTQGIDISLLNVTGGMSVVSLTNVSGADALGGHGLDLTATGFGATDSLDLNMNIVNFSNGFSDGTHIELQGAVGSTATIDIDGLMSGGAGDDGFDLDLISGISATVGTFNNVDAQGNDENGLNIHVHGGAKLTDFVANTLNLSGNGAGAGFDGIDVTVENAGSAATFNFSSLTVNNSGGRGIDLDVFNNGSLTFNVDGGTIDRSGLQGFDLNIGSQDEFGTLPVVNGPAAFIGTFANLDVTNSGQSLVFTADGVNVDIQGAGTTAQVNFNTLHANNNDEDGIDIRVTNGANATVQVDNGSTGNNNGTAGTPNNLPTGRGFSMFASGATTVANLSSASGPNGDNNFNNNLDGPGFVVDLRDGVTANFITVNASASGNSQDGVRILANDGTGVTINNFTVSGSALQVNNNKGNGLFVDFNQINGINDFKLVNLNVSGNLQDQIFVRFEGSTANPMTLGNFALHNINTTGTGTSGDGIEVQLLDTSITGVSTPGTLVPGTSPANLEGFTVFNVHSSNNGQYGLNLLVSEDPESSPIAPGTITAGIASGIVTGSEFNNNGLAGLRMRFAGDSVNDFEIYDNTLGFHNNIGRGVLIEVQDFSTYTMIGANPADFSAATRSFYNNTITNNGGVGFNLIASEPNDPDFFAPDGNGPRYNLDLGDILRNPNTITGNRDAAMAIIGEGDSTGSFTIRNAIMSNTTNGPDPLLNGDGLVLRLSDFGVLETLNVDGTASGLDISNNAGSGLVTSVNEDGRLGTLTRMTVLNTTIQNNALHGIDVQRFDNGLYGPNDNNNQIIIGATGAGNTLQGNTQNGINIVARNTQGGPIPFDLDVTDNNLISNRDGIFIRGTGNAQFIGNFSDNDFDAQRQDGIHIVLENDASFGDPELSSNATRTPFALDGNQVLNSARHGIFYDTNFTNENGLFGGGAYVHAHVRDSDVVLDNLLNPVRTLIMGNGGNGVQIIDNSDFIGTLGSTATIQNTYRIDGTDIRNNGSAVDNGNGIYVRQGQDTSPTGPSGGATRDANNGLSLIIGNAAATANNRDVQIIGNADDGLDLEIRDGDGNDNRLEVNRTTIRNNGADGDNHRNNDNGPQNVGHGVEIEIGKGEGNSTDQGNLDATFTNVDVLQNSGDGIDFIVTSIRLFSEVANVTMLGVNSSQNGGRGLDVNLRHDHVNPNHNFTGGGNSTSFSTWNIGLGSTDASNPNDPTFLSLINRFNENDREGVVFDTSARGMDQEEVNRPTGHPHAGHIDINNDIFIEVDLPGINQLTNNDYPSTKHGYYTGEDANGNGFLDPGEDTLVANGILDHRITAGTSQGTWVDPGTNNTQFQGGAAGMQTILDIQGTANHVLTFVQIANAEIANNGGFAGFEDGLVLAIGALTRMEAIIGNTSFGGNVGDDIRVYPQQSVADDGTPIDPPPSFRDTTGGHTGHSWLVYDPVAYLDLAFGVLDSTGGFSPNISAGNGRAANTATPGGPMMGNGDQITFLTIGTSQTAPITFDGVFDNNDEIKGAGRQVRLATVVTAAGMGNAVFAGGSDDNANNVFVQNGIQQNINGLFGGSLGSAFITIPAFVPMNNPIDVMLDRVGIAGGFDPSGYDTVGSSNSGSSTNTTSNPNAVYFWSGLLTSSNSAAGSLSAISSLFDNDEDSNGLFDFE